MVHCFFRKLYHSFHCIFLVPFWNFEQTLQKFYILPRLHDTVECLYTWYNRLSNGFDNRLYHVNGAFSHAIFDTLKLEAREPAHVFSMLAYMGRAALSTDPVIIWNTKMLCLSGVLWSCVCVSVISWCSIKTAKHTVTQTVHGTVVFLCQISRWHSGIMQYAIPVFTCTLATISLPRTILRRFEDVLCWFLQWFNWKSKFEIDMPASIRYLGLGPIHIRL